MAEAEKVRLAEPTHRLNAAESAARRARVEKLSSLESKLGTRIVVYFAGDRPNLQTVVAPDVQGLVYGHLRALERIDAAGPGARSVSLYLYTIGGITTAAWALVNLLREFSDTLTVIVPYKAHSAGTLIGLGADRLLLSKMAQLSPVDASLNSPYNPQAPSPQPGAPPQSLPVSVESVVGYLNLARKEVGLHEDNALAAVYRGLTDKVHPLALGEVYRSRELSSDIATRLLKMGGRSLPSTEIERIVDILTKRMGSHNYSIGRKEARELLGSWVQVPPRDVEDDVMSLFDDYADLLKLTSNPSLEDDLGSQDQSIVTYTRAVVESTARFDEFMTVRKLQRTRVQAPVPNVPAIEGYQQTLLREGWFTRDGTGP